VTVDVKTSPSLIRFRHVLALGTVLAACLAVSAPALAAGASSCAKQVIADWYDNGRVDKQYELRCYREAIKSIPVDVLDYSSAKEDIERALSFAARGKNDPGGPGSSGSGAGGNGSSGGTGGNKNGSGGPTQTTAEASVDTAGPSSVPIPLIVLGGLALLLLVGGSAGYISRRARGEGGSDDVPPATT
jgi:hypothetical protein